jgi:hypothetical protein
MTGTNGTNGHTNGKNEHAVNGNRTGDQFRSYHDDRDATSQETVYCTSNGVPYPHPYEVQRVGENGPLLLQDHHLIDLLSHFDRERIPVRLSFYKLYFICCQLLGTKWLIGLGTVVCHCQSTARPKLSTPAHIPHSSTIFPYIRHIADFVPES